MSRLPVRLTALALVLVASGCGTSTPKPNPGSAEPSLTGAVAGTGCPDLAGKGRQLQFGADGGAKLAGVVLGDGDTGVVLAHMSGADLCQWLPYGQELADRGYRVLAFDFAGSGGSETSDTPMGTQVGSAAAALRADGATAVVLMGGSMGGAAVLAAAAKLRPAPVAVVALSSPPAYADADALAAVSKLTVPVFYGAGELESGFPATAEQLYAATPRGTTRKLVLSPAAEHGVFLVDPGTGKAEFRSQVTAFLTEHAPPG